MFNFLKSIELVLIVVLGGGRTWGVIVAAVCVTLLPEVLRPVTPAVTGYPPPPIYYPTRPPYVRPTTAVTRYPLPTNTRRATAVPPTCSSPATSSAISL